MKFAPFWCKGEHGPATVWRWSFQSLEDARTQAVEAAQRLAERIKTGQLPQRRGYEYTDRPMREPVLRELRDTAGNLTGAITRNTYGSLVLNTAQAMFLDVDCGEVKAAGGGWRAWFGKPATPVADAPLQTFREKLDSWLARNPNWGMRLYRTKAGVRLLVTHQLFDPLEASRAPVFQELGVDDLYRKLCVAQSCFRARLTPKPWRCGIREKPLRWPWPDAAAESRFKTWDQKYHAASQGYATCKLVESAGKSSVHPEVLPIIRLHDEMTRAESGLPLA